MGDAIEILVMGPDPSSVDKLMAAIRNITGWYPANTNVEVKSRYDLFDFGYTVLINLNGVEINDTQMTQIISWIHKEYLGNVHIHIYSDERV